MHLPLQEIKTYLYYCEHQKNLDAKTIKAYRIDLKQFKDFLENSNMVMDKEGIKQYLYEIHNQYKQRTIKRKIASIKAFTSYLEYEELIEDNPFHKINTKFKAEFVLPRTIPRHIVEMFIKGMYEEKEKYSVSTSNNYILRDIAIIELLFATGIRVSELCTLKLDNVDMKSGTFRIMGKGSKERYMQVANEEVLLALDNYYEDFRETIETQEYFFLNKNGEKISEQAVRMMIRKYVDKYSIPMHLTPHMFRHAFATLMLEEEVDIRYIQKMLGHSSILTTQIYTYVATEKQKEILKLKHPRNKMIIF